MQYFFLFFFQPDVFAVFFSVIRWNFGIFLILFNGGVLLLVET